MKLRDVESQLNEKIEELKEKEIEIKILNKEKQTYQEKIMDQKLEFVLAKGQM